MASGGRSKRPRFKPARGPRRKNLFGRRGRGERRPLETSTVQARPRPQGGKKLERSTVQARPRPARENLLLKRRPLETSTVEARPRPKREKLVLATSAWQAAAARNIHGSSPPAARARQAKFAHEPHAPWALDGEECLRGGLLSGRDSPRRIWFPFIRLYSLCAKITTPLLLSGGRRGVGGPSGIRSV